MATKLTLFWPAQRSTCPSPARTAPVRRATAWRSATRALPRADALIAQTGSVLVTGRSAGRTRAFRAASPITSSLRAAEQLLPDLPRRVRFVEAEIRAGLSGLSFPSSPGQARTGGH